MNVDDIIRRARKMTEGTRKKRKRKEKKMNLGAEKICGKKDGDPGREMTRVE